MAIQLQLRRGTTTENDAFVGALGEVTVDTTTNQLRVHDGNTSGGFVTGKVYTAGSGITLSNDEFSISQNGITSNELNVNSTGAAGEALLSDGDGSFSWGAAGATINDDSVTDSSFYPTLADSTNGSFTEATISSTKLYFNPSTGTLNSTVFNSLSDKRTKENIKTIDTALDKTINLRGVSFTFKDTKSKSIGVIAQEIEEIMPEVVTTGPEGYKSVSYGNIVGLLIEAIKEQQTQINEIKEQLEKG